MEADPYSLPLIHEFIKRTTLWPNYSTRQVLTPPFEIKSEDFLAYAETDLKATYDHRLVNCLSNVKRSIDCQMDSLLYAFGLWGICAKEKWSFPQKVARLRKLGIVSPSIIERINRRRNLLEHSYKKPDLQFVEDSIDVASLFVEATKGYLTKAIIECEMVDEKKGAKKQPLGISVGFDVSRPAIYFWDDKRNKKGTWTKKVVKEVTPDDKAYDGYMRWYLKLREIF